MADFVAHPGSHELRNLAPASSGATADASAPGASATSSITDRRTLEEGVRSCSVNEFDGGRRVMLTIQPTIGSQFTLHFSADEWAAFQGLVAG